MVNWKMEENVLQVTGDFASIWKQIFVGENFIEVSE